MYGDPSIRYVALADDEVERRERRWLPTSSSRAMLFVLCSCAFSILCSWVNISILSYHDAFSAYTTKSVAGRRGNVYLGLEHVTRGRNLCRKRPFTYPTEYSVFRGDYVNDREKIHGHMDEVMFAFGGDVSALITFYVPDFGLENCTLTFRSVLPLQALPARTMPNRLEHDSSIIRPGFFESTTSLSVESSSTLDIYLLSGDASLSERRLIDRLSIGGLSVDDRVSTQPFWCPNSQNLYIQAQCLGTCNVQFGLQGMTTATSIYDFVNKTGFVITQHEHIDCV